MNINVHLPEGSIDRLLKAVERIADAAERFVGPAVPVIKPEPFDRSLWGYTDNATSRQVEEEERRAEAGFGPDYERALEAAAFSSTDQSGDKPKG
jgi:hypothetical protein